MKVGEKVIMVDNICEVVCTTEQGFVLEPIRNIDSKCKRKENTIKKPPSFFIKIGQYINSYI